MRVQPRKRLVEEEKLARVRTRSNALETIRLLICGQPNRKNMFSTSPWLADYLHLKMRQSIPLEM